MKCVLTLFVLIVALVGWSCGDKSGEDSHDNSINFKLVRTIGASMDTEANPCSDFHKYACGKWKNPDEYTPIAQVSSEVNVELIQYMDNTHMADKPEFVKKAYEFYTSCTDATHTNEWYFLKWLEEHENMKSALLSSPEDTDVAFDWVRTLATLRRYGMNDIFVEEHMKIKNGDSSKTIVDLKKPDYDSDDFESIKEYMVDAINDSMKLPASKKPIGELWNGISEFQERLFKLNDIKDDSGEKLITVKELPLAWLNKYLGVIFQQSPLDADMELSIKNIPYMEALEALLKEYDDKLICQYLEVRFLWHLYATIFPTYDDDCMKSTRNLFPMAMHWIYEQLHPELEKEIPKIQHIFSNIIAHVNQSVHSDKSVEVPETFLSKLDTIQLKIGNLPRVDTIEVLNSHYAPLKLKKSDVYGNYLQLLALHSDTDHIRTTKGYFNEIGNRLPNLAWKTLRPFYVPAINTIILPSELLKPPFYHWGYADVFTYGSIGRILARYIYDDLKFNGANDDDKEIMADYVSLKTSTDVVFSSFQDELNDKSYPLKGEQMSMKKLYFLNAAQYFCREDVEKKVHDKFIYVPQFAETFECKFNAIPKAFAN